MGRQAAELSSLITDMMDGDDDRERGPIQVPITSLVLDKVVRFCEHYQKEPSEFFYIYVLSHKSVGATLLLFAN